MNARSRCAAAVLAAVLPLLWFGSVAHADDPASPSPSAPTPSATTASPATSAAPSPSPDDPTSAAPSSEPTASETPASETPASETPASEAPASNAPSPETSASPAAPSASEPDPSGTPSAGDPSTTPDTEPSDAESTDADADAAPEVDPDAVAALAIEAEGTTVNFYPLGCATPQTPAAAVLEITNTSDVEISYLAEVSGPTGLVVQETFVVPAGDTASAIADEVPAGVYTISVTADDSAPLVDTAEVPSCPPPTTVSLTLQDPGCGYLFTGEEFAGTGEAAVVNTSDAVVQYDITVSGPGGSFTDGTVLFGGESYSIPLTGLPAGTYTLTVTTTDLTGEVAYTWTDTASLVACVLAPAAEVVSLGCFEAAFYLDNVESNVPVTFTVLGDNGTDPQSTGERLAEVTLEPGEEDDVDVAWGSNQAITVVATVQGQFSATLVTVDQDPRCVLIPAPITATAACGVVTFTNPADNAQVYVTWGSVVLDTFDIEEGSFSLAPGAHRVLMTKADFLVWIATLTPDADPTDEDYFLVQTGVLLDLQEGECPAPPTPPTPPTTPTAPAAPSAPTDPGLADTGAPADGGLAGAALLAIGAGACLLIRGRRQHG